MSPKKYIQRITWMLRRKRLGDAGGECDSSLPDALDSTPSSHRCIEKLPLENTGSLKLLSMVSFLPVPARSTHLLLFFLQQSGLILTVFSSDFFYSQAALSCPPSHLFPSKIFPGTSRGKNVSSTLVERWVQGLVVLTI